MLSIFIKPFILLIKFTQRKCKFLLSSNICKLMSIHFILLSNENFKILNINKIVIKIGLLSFTARKNSFERLVKVNLHHSTCKTNMIYIHECGVVWGRRVLAGSYAMTE